MLEISASAKISQLADIEESVRGTRMVISDGVVIDSFVKIKPSGGEGDLFIGAGSYINSGTVIYTGNGVQIGEGVLIASNCTLAPVNHEYRSKNKTILQQRFMRSKGGIIIEDDVWIGANTVICDGAIIRRGVVVGASSLVLGELEPYGVYAGNPLKLIRHRMEI
jgi:acetyltransferase-like isoleucine patch superfamily enzyme